MIDLKLLQDLLRGVDIRHSHAELHQEISALCCDTREISPGTLFVALRGSRLDGHDFIPQALAAGAAAVVCETPPEEEGPWIVVEDSHLAFALLSANWFDRPAEKLTLIAVTGTNGKTTVTTLLKSVLEEVLDTKAGLIGTNENRVGDVRLPAHRTTPQAYELQELLRQMVDAGCTHAVMEVSSHALMQHRTAGLHFAAGVFTNLTQDHLDYHGTMEAYRAAKGLLFHQTDKAILNLDDEAGQWYASNAPCPVYTYSAKTSRSDLTAENIRLFPDRVQFEAVGLSLIGRIVLPIPGMFSVYNALAVVSAGLCLGLELPRIAAALAHARGATGRLEVVNTPAPYTVIIDYAHTPDALENVLTAVRALTEKRVLCLVGCGGDRDRAKRPLMGEIAGRLADLTFLTSDNPRTEDPDAILKDILPGMKRSKGAYRLIPDRKEAIRAALAEAKEGDLLLLAGKGHETYQEVGGQTLHLDEREEIASYFGC